MAGNVLTVVLLVCATSSCFGFFDDFFRSKVCYDLIGCFSHKAPFTNSLRELPDSPEQLGVNLTLFTRANPTTGQALDYRDNDTTRGTHFDVNADTKVIVHGYIDNGDSPWMVNITDTLLQEGAFNVIRVSWAPGAAAFYPKAVANTRVVAAVVARFLTSLKGAQHVSMSSVHLIGHSLGAHVSGYVGKDVRGIARISGLDPAGPLFNSAQPGARLNATDADFVDCIHTNGKPLEDLGFGTLSAWCDVDFYPNGGEQQTGCPPAVSGTVTDMFRLKVDDAESAIACSHDRSRDLYIESVSTCPFRATRCDSYKDFQAGKCTCTASGCVVAMGYHADNNSKDNANANANDATAVDSAEPRGQYYLTTTGTRPFC